MVSPTFRFAGTVFLLTPTAGGKTLVAGDIGYVNGTPVKNVFRLNADLTLDTSFSAGAGAPAMVCTGVVQPDGKIVLLTTNGKVRLNADGSNDATEVSALVIPAMRW